MLLKRRPAIFVCFIFAFVFLTSLMTSVYVFNDLTVLVHRQPQNDGLSKSTIVVHGVDQTEAERIQHQRRTRAQRVCKNILGLKPVNILKDHLRFPRPKYENQWRSLTYLLDDRKVAFCLVLKAGYSNWLRFISSITTEGVAKLSKCLGIDTFDEIRPKLKAYKKVIFVRNPISRLLSGYVDKFVNLPNQVVTQMSRDIIKKVRGKAIPKSRRPDLTFPEFLHYISTTKEILNPHWLPIHELKVPCDIDYDFIGKIETVSRDIEYMKSLYNISKSAVYPQAYISDTKRTELMVNYYRNITTETLERVIQKYKMISSFSGILCQKMHQIFRNIFKTI
ncbi:carbohydrate sulfotransferase 11-like [Asterias rubens]|uniref:carbohydrate sulfotransferase 11-like n=1 Tax=Asterias rubens TaxID=7604 RepID=UPI001455B5BE|nr:carbohydrate sulfotransferase 11-like [Asterias rubens]